MNKIKRLLTILYQSFILVLPQELSFLRVKFYNRKGNKVSKKAFISPNVRITGVFHMDEGSSIAQNCTLSGENAGIFIGKNVMIAPNVVMVAFNHGFAKIDVPMVFQKNVEEAIYIEDDVWIASNCTIGKGVVVGKGSIIAANTFVNKSIPPYSIAGGVPVRIIKSRL